MTGEDAMGKSVVVGAVLVLCAGILPGTALAQSPSCIPPQGDPIYFCDELTGNKSDKGTVSGGSWTADGWRADAFGNNILLRPRRTGRGGDPLLLGHGNLHERLYAPGQPPPRRVEGR